MERAKGWAPVEHPHYVQYQVSGKAPKDSNPAINHPHLTFWAAQAIRPKGEQQGFRGEMKRLTALAWQPFRLAQVSKLLEPTKASPRPKQGPGPGQPESSLHWQKHHSLPHSCHGHSPGFEETGVSYSLARALMTWLKEALFLETLSQPQTLNISGPHQMGGIPKTLLSYSTELLRKLRSQAIHLQTWPGHLIHWRRAGCQRQVSAPEKPRGLVQERFHARCALDCNLSGPFQP